MLLEANYTDDLYDELIINTLYLILNEWNIKLHELTIFQDGVPDPIQQPHVVSFNDFFEEYCLSYFRFRKEWLAKLVGNIADDSNDNDHYDGLLQLPKFIIFDNRSKGRGDLLFLY